MKKIGIIGAGAWGTGLAMVARSAGKEAVLWALEPEIAEAVTNRQENSLYLPGVILDDDIRATTDLREAADADVVLLAVPTQFLRKITGDLSACLPSATPLVVCAKGIEQNSNALPSEIIEQTLPQSPLAVLSGPTFAGEVARHLPTAVTLACAEVGLRRALAEALTTATFRVYHSDDVIGAEIGGAVKNVLAIGCGIVEGRGLGDNARAALITRGLAEITRLAVAKGGRAETLMGLCGLGDLVLTCNAMQSRNFSLGVLLGQGEPLSEVLAGRSSVTEGVFSASSVVALAGQLGVEMPISAAVDGILNKNLDIDLTIAGLLARPVKAE